VFTAHFPVSIEGEDAVLRESDFLGRPVANVPASLRGVSRVNMSLGRRLDELRNMSVECEGMTEERAAWLGYIPSLIYCVMNDTGKYGAVQPSDRFKQMDISVDPGEELNILKRFVRELLSGQRDPLVARYYGALSSVGANSLVSYPLCYVKEIFTQLNISGAVAVLLQIFSKLESNLNSKHSGLAWECTVEVAIILRMMEAHWSGSQGPFELVPEETKFDLAFRTLPDECNTIENARVRMDTMIAQYTSPILIYVVSANACYPEVEGFVVYTNGSLNSAKIVGFQMKTADVKPRHAMSTEIISEGAVLIRGRVLAKRPRDPREGWRYMTSAQVREFLGNSLLLAMPREWLQNP